MPEVTQADQPSPPTTTPKPAESSPASPARAAVRGGEHQAQVKALTPDEQDGEPTWNVATAEIARNAPGGGVRLGHKQGIEQDDLKLAREQTLTVAKGQGTLAGASEARYRDPESNELVEQRIGGEVGVGKDGLAVGAQRARKVTAADGKKRTASGKAGWAKKGGVKAEGTLSREAKGPEGAHKTELSAGYAQDKGISVSQTDTREVADGASTKTTRGVGYGAEGPSGNIEYAKTLGDEKGDHLTTTAGASYEQGNLTLTRGEASTVGGTTTESGQRLVVGKDGVSIGHERKETVVGTDGSTEKKLGFTGNIADGEVGLNRSLVRKDQEGKERSATSGSTSVKVGDHGLEKVSADLSHRVGATAISAHGEYGFVVGEPRQVKRDGKDVWEMTVTKTLKGGGNLTVHGIGGGAQAGKAQSMTVVRNSRVELAALRGDPGALEAELQKPTDVKAVTDMKAGEQHSSGSSRALSGTAAIEAMGVKAGLQFTNGRNQKVTITKVSGTLVQVQYEGGESSGVSGAVTTPVAGFSGATQQASQRAYALEFDLGTPAGKAAYETFSRTGIAPQDAASSTRATESKANSSAISAFGVDMATSSQVTSSVEYDKRGKTETDVGTRTQAVSVPLLGSHKDAVGMRLVETNDKERSYMATASVTSTNASDAASALAHATGTHANRQASGKGSGTWNVSAEFSEAQIERLIELVRHGKVRYSELLTRKGEGEVLRRAVIAAGDDHDKIRDALAGFVSKTGAYGLAVIRRELQASPRYDVELVGDKYLTGEKVRVEIERQKKSFEARASQSGVDSNLLVELDEVIAFHRERSTAIESHSNYAELPRQLRASEVARSRDAVAIFGALRQRVASQAHLAQQEQEMPIEGATEQSFREPAAAVSTASPETIERTTAWRAVETARSTLDTQVLPAVERSFAEARRRHWIHGGAFSLVEPRSKLGHSSVLGAGKHANDYRSAEARLDFGKFHLDKLTKAKNALLTELTAAETANLGFSPPATNAVKALTARLENLSASFQNVAVDFREVTAIYRRIEAANPALRNWEPSEVMPDGYYR